MNWKQFTVYHKDSPFYPTETLVGFLRTFREETKQRVRLWHFLFEPTCLVRFVAGDPDKVLDIAKTLATKYGLDFELGDVSKSSPSRQDGVDYTGEADFYGEDLWTANAKFLDGMTDLALELNKRKGKAFVDMAVKNVHLFCNMLGMNYAEEVVFHQLCADRSAERYKQDRTQ